MGPSTVDIFTNDLANGFEGMVTKFTKDTKLGGVADALEDRISIQNDLDEMEK